MIYVGTSGYSYKEWKGSLYPPDLPDRKMLGYYAERFRTVEMNYTFHRIPAVPVAQKWAEQVPTGFRFALKAPQLITHVQRLRETAGPLARFLEAAEALQERLGPVLFQLPPGFRKETGTLRDFLSLLPRQQRVAFEFRHESWFSHDIYELLHGHGAALCLSDAETKPQVPFLGTAPWGYLRLRRPAYGQGELDLLADRVLEQGWRDLFVYFKHEEEGKGPRLAKQFLELVERKEGSDRGRGAD